MNSALAAPNLLAAVAKTNVAAVPDYDPIKVNSTFAKIRSTFFQPRVVWKDEVTAVSTSFERLNPSERRSLVNLLSRAPNAENHSLLNRWLDRAMAQGVGAFDGLGEKGSMQMCKQLVVGQDAQNLVRIFASISDHASPAITGSEQQRMQFAQALASTGTAQQKLGWVSELKRNVVAGSIDASTNTTGRAIAVVMTGSTDPKLLSGFMAALGRVGMDAVVQASAPTCNVAFAESLAVSVGAKMPNAHLFQKLAATVARLGNTREKAAFVAASGKVIDDLYANRAAPKTLGEVSGAISAVIGTDTTAVIENVMMQNTTQGGRSGPAALKSYVQALLESGNGAADIGTITLQLQRGNELKQDPMKYLAQRESRSGEQPTCVRARVMGGWLGLVGSAVQVRTGRRDANAAYASQLFTASIDTLKEVVGARFPCVKAAMGVATPALKTAVNMGLLTWRNQAAQADRNFAQGLVEGALPRYRSGVEATAEWTLTMKAEQSRRFNGF